MICDSNGGRLVGRRMSWITNQWAPYRRPVWEHLGRFIELSVHILQPSLEDIQSQNKGDDWMVEGNLVNGYKVGFPATLALNLHGSKLSFLLAPWRVVQSSEVVVLGGWESPAYWQALLLARLKRCRRSDSMSQRCSQTDIGRVLLRARDDSSLNYLMQ